MRVTNLDWGPKPLASFHAEEPHGRRIAPVACEPQRSHQTIDRHNTDAPIGEQPRRLVLSRRSPGRSDEANGLLHRRHQMLALAQVCREKRDARGPVAPEHRVIDGEGGGRLCALPPRRRLRWRRQHANDMHAGNFVRREEPSRIAALERLLARPDIGRLCARKERGPVHPINLRAFRPADDAHPRLGRPWIRERGCRACLCDTLPRSLRRRVGRGRGPGDVADGEEQL
mmetsp:Transcript_5969/g.18353  ORF Transcript_5969/g.18353 Transcript_5969/m.18353 type:complete len:229 (-) Transcript_5969:123-809(-)